MTERLHCDVKSCNKVIEGKGGHVKAEPLGVWEDGTPPYDFCLDHYNEYKTLVRAWLKGH